MCAAYQGKDYTLSEQCFTEDFQLYYWYQNHEVFRDILSFNIFSNATEFNINLLNMVDTVKSELVVCGCAEMMSDLSSWYSWHVADTKVYEGFEALMVSTFKAFLQHPGYMTLFAIGQVFMTLTFNFYYLGYMIGRMAEFIFKA